ncbi:hypothetical protein MKEN_00814000 [Mycena kentingensis (nom. inval.)]|nr:hypothetical protein MKEN_00814000 [Mycena kentingensis (nom. inval.)]
MASSPDDTNIRRLLDARYARSALPRYDSPSIYSVSAFMSPQPADAPSYRSPTPGGGIDELARSLLDVEDDEQRLGDSDDDTAAGEHDLDEKPQDDQRMSFLGPRLRIVGRAPWEGGDALEEDDEEPEPERSGRGRDFKKGLGFRSSSRGTTASSRPSGESSRSFPRPKRSFETTSSMNSPQGRRSPFGLNQANISSTSLVPQQSSKATGLRINFPMPRSDSPSGTSSYPSSPRAPGSPVSISSLPNKSPLTRRATNESATGPSLYPEDMHPYANPDLVFSYADDPSPTPAPNRSGFRIQSVARSESSATVTTESLSTAPSLTRSVSGSTLTPDSSSSSMSPSSPRVRASMFHGKEISAPLPIQQNSPASIISSPLMAPIVPPGWTERSSSPNFSLISLEEARAQRTRSATTHPSMPSTSSTPFPEATSAADGQNYSPNSVASRSRARSISTGARAKAAFQTIIPPKPERRDSEPSVASQALSGPPSAKALKHKKSGFMRLFNSGRSGADDRNSPPPVPPLSDEYSAFNAQQSQTGGVRSAKSSIHRIPPPEVSPSMLDMVPSTERLLPASNSRPPHLSIKTGPQARLRAASTVDDFQTRTAPPDRGERDWAQTEPPQSAPANVTEFPALKLRPVSTLFSSHFTDHMLPRDSDSQPSLDGDIDTLSSTSPTSLTPITPGIIRTTGDKSSMATISEDQSSMGRSVQERLDNPTKAWQRHIWELEGQVRSLQSELDKLRLSEAGEYCEACGRGRRAIIHEHQISGVVNRPRARTGTSSRFGSAV